MKHLSKKVTDWKNEVECLEAVKENGLALQFVKNQTEAICLEAVKENGYVLEYVKEQTPEIIRVALSQNQDAIDFVNTNKFKVEFVITELTKEE